MPAVARNVEAPFSCHIRSQVRHRSCVRVASIAAPNSFVETTTEEKAMKFTWASNAATPQARAVQPHFAIWDFLKLLMAAIMYGIAVSVVAAAIALVLANDASAEIKPAAVTENANAAKPDFYGMHPYPGTLFIGKDCEADIIEATERDWKVTIDGKNVDVRVMQTFIMPDTESTAATFSALLPPGARMLRLTAYTNASLMQGKIFDADSYGKLTNADFRNHSRKGLLIVQNDDGAISTDAIVNIAPHEAVTIEYTYRLALDEADAAHNLMLALTNDNTFYANVAEKRITSGAVWVEWKGQKPAQLFNVSSGASLETAGSKITGLSWEAPQLDRDSRFQLAWTM
jgi:hypothetical protein